MGLGSSGFHYQQRNVAGDPSPTSMSEIVTHLPFVPLGLLLDLGGGDAGTGICINYLLSLAYF